MATSLPSTMKAAKRLSPGSLDQTLSVIEVPLPKHSNSLPADYVLLKVSYVSLNPFDIKFAEAPIISTLAFKGIPCLDFAGVVVDSNSTRFEKDQLVYGQTQPPNFGACAEYIVVAAGFCMPVPEGVKLEDASTIGIAGLTAYQAIAPFVKPGEGDKVFINGGSGGIGTYGIQIAKALGCFVTTSCSGANVASCKELGADEVIDYRTQNLVETLERSGKQYDLLVDNVFSDPQLYWQCHSYLKPTGKYATMAASPSFAFLRAVLPILFWPTMLGGGQRKFQLVGRKSNIEDYERIAEWIRTGEIRVVIEKVYRMEDIKEAFARLKSGRVRGKLVVKIAE